MTARTLRLVAATAIVLVASVTASAVAAFARFSDTGTVTSGPIATHTVVSQAQPACDDVDGLLILGNVARLTWTKTDARYEYYWELRNMSGTAVASGTVGDDVSAGATAALEIGTGLIAVNANYNVVVQARLTSSPSWTAASTTTTPVHRASIALIGLAFRCGHR